MPLHVNGGRGMTLRLVLVGMAALVALFGTLGVVVGLRVSAVLLGIGFLAALLRVWTKVKPERRLRATLRLVLFSALILVLIERLAVLGGYGVQLHEGLRLAFGLAL
ncbi:hypothetical protein FBZ89_108179 [Nitrospirillum amazonense]|uniref:Uncharacterized protein n=1 Tax=Nitrospirillum amazonense TaxID=28077 RepID=A0A560FBY0_9PROT|nr:hypothetical protein [Nitrospirillum amazonense]TWB19122.1 hypothetical protein FBZ89_108179 [Nitrospirillum amazonense]